MPDLALLIALIVMAWTYDFYNGANDCANAIATTVSTGALTRVKAILLASFFNIVGAFITTAVAKTIGKGIVDPSQISLNVLAAGVLAAIIWSAFCTRKGIPISVTHALVGGIIGAAVAAKGFDVLKLQGIFKIVIAMFLSPLVGYWSSYGFMKFIEFALRNVRSRKIDSYFRYGQIFSASAMALSHGMNDTQNAMGVITAGLVIYGSLHDFTVPFWVILSSGLFMGLGTAFGGWRVIKTMGMKMARIRTPQGFGAEASSTAVITLNSLIGAPISTTQVISCAIMGVGKSQKPARINWDVATDIFGAWFLTIPLTALAAVPIYLLLKLF